MDEQNPRAGKRRRWSLASRLPAILTASLLTVATAGAIAVAGGNDSDHHGGNSNAAEAQYGCNNDANCQNNGNGNGNGNGNHDGNNNGSNNSGGRGGDATVNINGVPGQKGEKGEPGAPGSTGATGQSGNQGKQGVRGTRKKGRVSCKRARHPKQCKARRRAALRRSLSRTRSTKSARR